MISALKQKLSTPTLFVVIGIIISLIIVLLGEFYSYALNQEIKVLVEQCVRENEQNKQIHAGTWRGRADLICDPEDLRGFAVSSKNADSIQAKIASKQLKAKYSKDEFIPFACVVLFLSALPWMWYFLLRRIEELRISIIGK